MLTYKIGNHNLKTEYVQLTDFELYEKDGELWIFKNNKNERFPIMAGDTVVFNRTEDIDVHFNEEKIIKTVGDNKSFSVGNFTEERIRVHGVAPLKLCYSPNSNLKHNYLSFDLNDKHGLIKNRIKSENDTKNAIKELLYGKYDSSEADDGKKRCIGDKVLQEDNFLYSATNINSNNRYVFGGRCENISGKTIFIEASDSVLSQISPDFIKEGRIVLNNCIVPVTKGGIDDRYHILWEIEDDNLAEILLKNAPNSVICIKDERFITQTFYASEKGLKCEIKPGTEIFIKKHTINIMGAIMQDMQTNLLQEDILKGEYIDSLKSIYKNKTVDYEKQVFTPVYETVEGYKSIKEIRFNLHFREREDYEEWKPTETESGGTWNQMSKENGDMLGLLGFSDEDILYRRRKLGESFLRLSFYDGTDRRTQNLIFTSTIFIDETSLYQKYMTAIKNGVEKEEGGYVFTRDAGLFAEFSCKNKYDSSSSSEGFYLYLFPSLIKNKEIYMKVEFNHAKYGYTIPMIWYDNEPHGYRDEATNIVNMNAVMEDMYYPIEIFFRNGRYEWKFDNRIGADSNGVAELNFYEPAINNPYTTEQEDADNI